MIDFEKYYGNLDVYGLVEIIESIDEYDPKVIKYCLYRLDELKVPKESILEASETALSRRFFKYFSTFKYLKKETIYLDSYFFSEEEVKNIFYATHHNYIQYVNNATLNMPT
ncbi:hypothetical protein [Tenacibaculum sp. 190524A05c]|uniref:hypothetical protein n=1 Tax=Tenacibaculum platacis TaxID=3137852 RepID=UPI0032B1E7DA